MIWDVMMNQQPRIKKHKLTADEFLKNYPILKVSGDLQFYQDYLRKERRIINLYGESFLKELLKEKELNGEEN